VRKRGYKRSN